MELPWLTGLCPSVICLQETFLKPSDNLDIRGYTLYNHIHQAGDKASGGSSVILHNSIPQSQIQLNTSLQAVAVKATLHKTIHVCSLYLPPSDRINIADLEHLIQQPPKPFIIMGDFNSHSNIWGCRDKDQKGRIIEDVINRNNLPLYNNKTYTCLHPGTGTYSPIDVTLADASIFLDYSWKVHDDTCGSDHFPIILENSGPGLDDKIPRWNLRRANWDEFKNSCILKLKSDANNTVDDNITYFSKTLISIAEESIPKTSNKKLKKSWFNDDCKAAIRSRKAALRKFNLQPSAENLNNFKMNRAKTRRVIKTSKKTSWQNYVSKLKSSSKSKKVWDMIRKISGKNSSGPIKHLSKNHIKATNKKDIADLLAKKFSNNSSSNNYSKQFQHIKKNAEKTKLNFKSNNLEYYDHPFSLSELTDCIMKSHGTAVGPDEIHYEFLKNLPSCSLDFLLQAFNDEVWVSGKFPSSWKQATIISITKPGKDNTDPSNYRPIALTS